MSIFRTPATLLPFGIFSFTTFMPMTVTTALYASTIDRWMSILSWSQSAFFQAPQDAANYWNVQFAVRNNVTNIQVFLDTYNSFNFTANQWSRYMTTTFAFQLIDPFVYYMIEVYFAKVGAPGGAFGVCPAVWVQT